MLLFINFFTVKFLWFSKITRKNKAHLSHYWPQLFTVEAKGQGFAETVSGGLEALLLTKLHVHLEAARAPARGLGGRRPAVSTGDVRSSHLHVVGVR